MLVGAFIRIRSKPSLELNVGARGRSEGIGNFYLLVQDSRPEVQQRP